jgi:hypothetical protein
MKFIYPIHSYLRRHFGMVEQVITAAGLAAILYGLMQLLPSYPPDWGIVITGVVFFLGIVSPVAGYFVAVLAAAYPLYLVSIYIAVIFLAIAVIGQHAFIQNPSGALLSLASPLLGAIYLSWTIPLLGGLWWGPAGGAIIGGVAAFWMELVAGMAYLPPDLINLLGILPVITDPFGRFASANSLEVLKILFLPLASNSSTLLYHILQIVIWSFVGWMVGMLNEKDWVQFRRPKSSISIAVVGVFTLVALQILLNLWLGSPINGNAQIALGLTAFSSLVAVIMLEFIQHFFEHPLPISIPQSAPIQFEMEGASSPNPMPVPALPEMSEDDKSDDLIMLELD